MRVSCVRLSLVCVVLLSIAAGANAEWRVKDPPGLDVSGSTEDRIGTYTTHAGVRSCEGTGGEVHDEDADYTTPSAMAGVTDCDVPGHDGNHAIKSFAQAVGKRILEATCPGADVPGDYTANAPTSGSWSYNGRSEDAWCEETMTRTFTFMGVETTSECDNEVRGAALLGSYSPVQGNSIRHDDVQNGDYAKQYYEVTAEVGQNATGGDAYSDSTFVGTPDFGLTNNNP